MNNDTLISIYEFIRIVFIVLDIILFLFVIFLFIKAWRFRPKFVMTPEGDKPYVLGTAISKENWESIVARSKINSAESIKGAIIDADNFVDDMLKRMRIEGETMAERIERLSTSDFHTFGQLSAAHQIRNRLVHEPEFSISNEEAGKVLENYEAFLKEIGAI